MKKGYINDFCKVIAGQSPRGSSYNDVGDGMEFHQGKKAFGDVFLESSNVWTTEITKIAEPGDILMSVRAPVGPTNITNRKVCIGRGLAAIRCSESVLPNFILYALRNIENKIVGNDGAVFNSINKKMIERLPVPLFDKNEQQEIVDYLDSAFAKIDEMKANAEKALNEAKALFQASLKELLEPKEGWEEKKLVDIVDKNSAISYGIVQPGNNVSGGVPVVRPVDLIQKVISLHDGIKRTSKENSDSYKRTLLNGKEILMCVRGSTGVVSLTNSSLVGSNVTRGIVPIKIEDEFLRLFTYYSMIAPVASEFIQTNTRGAALKQINIADVKLIPISIPSREVQQEIVTTLDSIKSKVDQLQENYDKIAKECDTLKQAILKQVFE